MAVALITRLGTMVSCPAAQSHALKPKAQRFRAALKISKKGLSPISFPPHRCTPDASVRAGRALRSSVLPDRRSKDEHGYE
jgi:hypothetical protein